MSKSQIDFARRGFVASLGAAAVVCAAPVYSKTSGYIKGAGQYRRLAMFSGQTHEDIDIIYWVDGQPIPEAVAEINWFMRDWREGAAYEMKRENLYILSAVHNLLETTEPMQLLSGYRTKKTNDTLRRQSRSVSRNSLHLKGMAADIRVRGFRVNTLAKAARACSYGGVGKYSSSNFVHIDCGEVRTWSG